MLNKRGVMTIDIVFAGLFFSAFVAAMISRPGHIVKRANEKCAYFQTSENCSQMVEEMSQSERIDYIRDTVDSPSDVWMR